MHHQAGRQRSVPGDHLQPWQRKESAPLRAARIGEGLLDHGYLVFAVQRHGHGQSTGDYIGDLEKQINESGYDLRERARQKMSLQDIYNQDVVDAVGWLSNGRRSTAAAW
jgi:hypothetical protein